MQIYTLNKRLDDQMLTRWMRKSEKVFVGGKKKAFTSEEFIVYQADEFNGAGLGFDYYPVMAIDSTKHKLYGVLKLSKTDNIELYL